jgi:outer membrane protein OmpA-like peptidoglycan-associated protein
MKKLSATFFIACTIYLLAVPVLAQTDPGTSTRRPGDDQSNTGVRPQNFGIGLAVGMTQLSSDVGEGNTFTNTDNPWQFGGSIHAQYALARFDRLAKLLGMAEIGFHPYKATGTLLNSIYEAKATAIDISLGAQFELFPEWTVRPFIFGMIGYGMFTPTASWSQNISAALTSYKDQLAGTDKGTLVIPFGGGLAWMLNDNLDIFARFHKTMTFTDNMDGWVSNINDNYSTISLGLTYFLGDGAMTEAVVPPPKPVVKDSDQDGLNDEDETKVYHTDPFNKDTDGDGLMDGDEIKIYRTDPTNKDSDGDGISDGDEVLKYHTDPLNKDTDGDGCMDGDEVNVMKTNPLKTDTDGDGLTDCDEVKVYHTDPLKRDTDGDGVDDGTEVKNGTDPLKADVLKMDQGQTTFVLEGITFETAKATILPSSEDILMKAYNTLRTNPNIKVEISGHTDNVGAAALNMRLSQARATSVRDWLVKKGIDPTRLTAKGYGKTQPMVPNDSEENKAKNRRIEFKILP